MPKNISEETEAFREGFNYYEHGWHIRKWENPHPIDVSPVEREQWAAGYQQAHELHHFLESESSEKVEQG
jgi:hypothetical protein